MPTQPFPSKQCPSCRRMLPMDSAHFTANARTSQGFNSYCKQCNSEKAFLKNQTKYGPAKRPRREQVSILNFDIQNRLVLNLTLRSLPAQCVVYDILKKATSTMTIKMLTPSEVQYSIGDSLWSICCPNVDQSVPTILMVLKQNNLRLEESHISLHQAISEYFYM